MATFGLAVGGLLVIGYLTSASAQQEDLQSPALFAAQHAQNGDVIALPDHAITSAIDYYLASDKRHINLWPQLGVGQRMSKDLTSRCIRPVAFRAECGS
jgi:hypothetical protein